MATRFAATGSQISFWGLNNSGYCQGTNGALANAADSGMGQIYGQKSKNLPLGQARVVPILGDNSLQTTMLLPTGTPTQGELVTSIMDPTFSTAPVGLLVNTANSQDLALMGVPCPVYKSMTMIQNSPGQNMTSGSQGIPGYMVEVWPNVFANPRANLQTQDATAQEFTTDLVAGSFGIMPWGAAIASGTYGATQGTRLTPFFSLAAWTIHALQGDGIVTTVTLAQTPYSTDGTYVQVYDNGTALVYGGGAGKYTVSGKVVTFGTAPVAGHKVEIWYGFTLVC